MGQSIKIIVYDWNGTLLDDAEDSCRGFNHALSVFGCNPITLAQYREFYDFPLHKLYCSAGISEEKYAFMVKQGLASIYYDYYEPLADVAQLRNGATKLLHQAHKSNIKQLILSNHIVSKIYRQTDRLGITKFFTAIIGRLDSIAEELTKGEKLMAYMNENQIDPSHAIIVGDSSEEILIAHKYGLKGIGITGGYSSEARLCSEKPYKIIHSLNELWELIE